MYILPIIGVIGEDFKFSDLLMHLNAAKDEPIIKLLFNSPGGYVSEADKMVEALQKEKKLYYSTNLGDVASAAVELFLVAPRENRTFNPDKGLFLIHMPFIGPEDGGVTGGSEDIQYAADQMKEIEKRMTQKYSKATGTSINILSGFMKENIPLTEEQVYELGFATIVRPTLKAVAFYNQKDTQMSKETEEKVNKIEGLLKTLLAKLKVTAKALVVQDAEGKDLDFGEAVTNEGEIVVGVSATVDGAAAEGEFTLADGRVLVFAGGVLNEIRPAEGAEMEALKQKNKDLEKQLEDKTAELDTVNSEFEKFKNETSTQLTEVNTQLQNIKAEFSKGKPKKSQGTEGDEHEKRRPFKEKE